jgi:hypothetical protein
MCQSLGSRENFPRATAPLLPNFTQRIIVGVDGETIDYELNSPLLIFDIFYKIYPPPETGKVVRNRSAKGHQFSGNRQHMMLSGFLSMLWFDSRGKVSGWERYADVERSKTGIQWFGSGFKLDISTGP